MEILRLPAEEAAVSRFLEDLWAPYNRELESIVDGFAVADGVDLVTEEREFVLDRLESEHHRTWVAVDGSDDDRSLADTRGDFAGFVATDVDECPSSFDRPDRLVVCDIYVRESYRGSGLARTLFDRARTRARETGCTEFKLDVDVDNDRAIAFYERLGFEPIRYTMTASVAE